MLHEDLNSTQNLETTEDKSYDVLSGDNTQFVEKAVTRLPAWAKSSAAVIALGQFNLMNNRAFQVLASRVKKVS
ncbi:MAG: hypothetical protein HQM15_02015 [Deltaproteobacteria bacterium]|nr:hypothetical protein [Deltaproteobacteria bacterium]